MTDVKEKIVVKARVTVELFDMKDGQVTAFVYDGNLFRVVKNENVDYEDISVPLVDKKPNSMNVVERYIVENDLQYFEFSKFLGDNPDQLSFKNRIEGYVSKLVSDKKLVQLSNNRFKVTDRIGKAYINI